MIRRRSRRRTYGSVSAHVHRARLPSAGCTAALPRRRRRQRPQVLAYSSKWPWQDTGVRRQQGPARGWRRKQPAAWSGYGYRPASRPPPTRSRPWLWPWRSSLLLPLSDPGRRRAIPTMPQRPCLGSSSSPPRHHRNPCSGLTTRRSGCSSPQIFGRQQRQQPDVFGREGIGAALLTVNHAQSLKCLAPRPRRSADDGTICRPQVTAFRRTG